MKYNSKIFTLVLAMLFFVGYTLTIGSMYPDTLRTMEANCWTSDYLLQFFRWPYVGAGIMALPMTLCMGVAALLLRVVRLGKLLPLSVFVALGLAYAYPPTAKYNWGEDHLFSKAMNDNELIYAYQRLAYAKNWHELRTKIIEDGEANSDLGMRYLLLVESAQGTLTENLFNYPIDQTEKFLFRGFRSDVTCTFNIQFYDNIGVWDECYHQAQEYAMCQRDFCLRSVCQMIDYSIKESEWQVAEKLCYVLEEALFYHDFVKDRRAEIARLRKVTPVNPAPIRADNFVTGYVLQNEMVHDCQQHIGDSVKIMDYVASCLLIRKRVDQLNVILHFFEEDKGRELKDLPLPFQQAIEIYRSQGQALRDEAPGTYAYYFYNTPIPEQEDRYEISTTN